jgi:hypothetical protein
MVILSKNYYMFGLIVSDAWEFLLILSIVTLSIHRHFFLLLDLEKVVFWLFIYSSF